jgi:imidazolonepropionase-like amidohydrolase
VTAGVDSIEHGHRADREDLEMMKAKGTFLARKIHDFRGTKGLAMVQIRCLGRFETKSEAFA